MSARSTLTRFALVAAAVMLGACAEADLKSAPGDLESSSSESTISNYYTTIVGELPLGEPVADTIDWPDYFLGRTRELRAGQVIELAVTSNRKSLVHVYGPAYGWHGEQPLFGGALVRTQTTLKSGKQRATVIVTAPADGTYLVVYGPLNVWRATYTLTATCLDGCGAPLAGEGEVCGGFRPPGAPVAVCEPVFSCVAPYDVIPDLAGRCGQFATVAQLLADPGAYDGRYVAIRGVVDSSLAACTKIGCPNTDLCCNACSAQQKLFDADAQVGVLPGIPLAEGGAALTCSGNSCTWQDGCAIEDGGVWVSGWFRFVDGVAPMLELERRFATP